jgi:23S rRNA pseudouridine2605 synthase
MTDQDQPEGERLQKVLAAAGVASRRVVEDMIVAGRIEVDGRVVTELGTRIRPDARVSVDGTAVQLDVSKRYLMLNKPTGVVSTMRDEQGRRDLREFTDEVGERVYNVGRLDADTSGLLLLTNDGELAHVLAHPSFGVEKTYVAKVRGTADQRVIRTLLDGFELDDGEIHADAAKLVGRPSQGHSMIELTLHSGRNRIVRRMLDHVGHPVVELVRRSFGPLHLGTLRSGRVRELTSMERGAILTLARSER